MDHTGSKTKTDYTPLYSPLTSNIIIKGLSNRLIKGHKAIKQIDDVL